MRKLKRVPWCLFLIVFLTIGTIIMIYPFIWMVSASFKEVAEMYQIPPTVIPRNPTIKNTWWYSSRWACWRLCIKTA